MILNKWKGQSKRKSLLLRHRQGTRCQPWAWKGPLVSVLSGPVSVLSKYFHMHSGQSQD